MSIVAVTVRDVTARQTREAELEHLARHDALTSLPNRVCLFERLGTALRDRAGETIALMMLDLDGFKEVNDALGHSTGDTLMIELGRRLGRLARPTRHVARVGGDEFAIVWTGRLSA